MSFKTENRKFQTVFHEASVLKKVADAVKELAGETNIKFDETGFHFQTMDSSHVALCQCNIDTSHFKSYQCDGTFLLGINFGSLTKVLKCVNPTDTMTLSVKDNNPDCLDFLFESKNDIKTSSFEMKLMDIDEDELGIPDQDYQAVIKMSSFEFQSICQNLTMIDDSVKLIVNKKGITFESEGEMGKASIALKSNDQDVYIQMDDTNEEISADFALRYFNFFTKATPLSHTVILHLTHGFPIVVEYNLNENGNGDFSSTDLEDATKNSFIKYYLAPKME